MTTAAPPPEHPIQATRALCGVCGRFVDARVTVRDDRVFLVKWCAEHGKTEALVCSDAAYYLRSLDYVKPPTAPRARAIAGFDGCPTSCGLCPEHEQHTCVPLLEITDACNLDCPICLVAGPGSPKRSLAEVARMIDRLVVCEGTINMLTLSGGEPTMHPDLLAIVDAARRPEIAIVSLSTNGILLSERDDLVKALVDRDVVISLQIDGVEPRTYERLRGRAELAERKVRLIERIVALGGRVSMTMTLARGVNEHEVPAILRLLSSHERIVSLMVQPLARTARARARLGPGPIDPITIPDVIALIADGSDGRIERRDFTPLPCSHPTCFALTYLLRTDSGALVPLSRILDPDVYVDTIKNQALLNTDPATLERMKDALYRLWSSSGIVPERDAVLQSVRRLLLDLGKIRPEAPHSEVVGLGVRWVKSIFIHSFMDRDTFDLSRAIKCCNHYVEPDGRLLPACIRNNVPKEQYGRTAVDAP